MNYEEAKKVWNRNTSTKSAYYEARFFTDVGHEKAVIFAVHAGDRR